MSEFSDVMLKAMQDHEKRTLDAAVRVIGKLVEEYTLQGKCSEAVGAAAAMQLMKMLRDGL